MEISIFHELINGNGCSLHPSTNRGLAFRVNRLSQPEGWGYKSGWFLFFNVETDSPGLCEFPSFRAGSFLGFDEYFIFKYVFDIEL